MESAYDVNWFVSNCRGVVLVHVVGTGGVNHLVCVDGRAKIIQDSMDWRPMHLSRAALQCCVGDGSDIRRFLYAEGSSKMKQKGRRMSRRQSRN